MTLKRFQAITIGIVLSLPLAAGLHAVALADDGENGQGENDDGASVNVADMDQNSTAMLDKMRGTRKYVAGLLDQARKDKDIIKVTCLNDKLTQINVAVRTFEDRMVSLRTAVTTQDKESISHEYKILTVLDQKVDGLRMEAEACIGESEGYLGKTEVTVTTPPGEAELDPTTFEGAGPDIVERPMPASAFM